MTRRFTLFLIFTLAVIGLAAIRVQAQLMPKAQVARLWATLRTGMNELARAYGCQPLAI